MKLELSAAPVLDVKVALNREVPAIVLTAGISQGGNVYVHRTILPLGRFECAALQGRAEMLAEALEELADEFRTFANGNQHHDVVVEKPAHE